MSNEHIQRAGDWITGAENTRAGEVGDRLDFAQAEALLAIAYELRTKNLLALARGATDTQDANRYRAEAINRL
jgi:hypothetical protein